MRLFWSKCQMRNSGDGHFIRKSENVMSWRVSKAVDKVNEVNRGGQSCIFAAAAAGNEF